MNKTQRKIDAPSGEKGMALKLPIYLTIVYLVFSLVVYILCPYHWQTKRPVLFWTLNVLYIIAISAGYLVGLKHPVRFRRITWTESKTDKLLTLVSIGCVINFILYGIYIFRCHGLKTLDFLELWNRMCVGFKDPGLGYKIYQDRLRWIDGVDVLGGTGYTLISLVWAFVEKAIAILSLLYFKKLKPYGKFFSVAYLVLVVALYVSIGTNIQIFNVFLLLELPIILKTFTLWHGKQLRKKHVVQLFAFLFVGIFAMMLYFGWMLESRHAANGVEASDYIIGGYRPDLGDTPSDTSPAEPSATAPAEPPTTAPAAPPTTAPAEPSTTAPAEPSVTAPAEPPTTAPAEPADTSPLERKLTNFWLSASSYLSQGYYGMSQALTLDWVPMYGVGNSMFLVNMISGHIYDIDQYTYQVRLEPLGWDSDVRWHTMYTWVANDVSFYGVVAVMFLIGCLFGMMFRDAITTENPFAKASIFFFILMLLFIPCNNQIAQSNQNLCPFLLLVLLWLLCGREPDPVSRKAETKKD